MNNVKVVFGFVELAAAFEFFGWARLITRESVIAVWIACSVAAALYLFGVFRSKHDMKPEGLGTVRICFATALLFIAAWLIPGLSGTPLSVPLIESFLVPNTERPSPKSQVDDLSLQINRQEEAIKRLTAFIANNREDSKDGGATGNLENPASKPPTIAQATYLTNPALKEALADAKKEGRPIFVDITGKN